MSDLIERQAAIDALGEQPTGWSYGEYEEGLISQWKSDVETIKQLPSAEQPNSSEIPNSSGTVYRQAAIDALKELTANGTNKGMVFGKDAVHRIEMLQPAQQSLSEEYAKAVRNWLVNYQIKCAELKGRYTPYEVLGWIVSDWRKENGIW